MIILTRSKKIIFGIVAGAALILGLLAYYQSQGLLKVFPTREDRRIKQILVIDRAKFAKAEGLPDEQFEAKIAELMELKKRVEDNPADADAWFDFASHKEFLNDHEGAARAWEKSFELQNLNFVTAANLGNVYQYFLKDYEKAEFYYKRALELRPDFITAYQGLADVYRFNWKEKQHLLEPLLLEAVKKDPQNSAVYYGSLVEFFAPSDITAAKKYLEEIKKINPQAEAELIEAYPQLR